VDELVAMRNCVHQKVDKRFTRNDVKQSLPSLIVLAADMLIETRASLRGDVLKNFDNHFLFLLLRYDHIVRGLCGVFDSVLGRRYDYMRVLQCLCYATMCTAHKALIQPHALQDEVR
jgi:hypothetical protein